MEKLQVGGRVIDRDEAREYARRYLTAGRGWAYPSYDGYMAASAGGPLVDADLLAPVLLNVRMSISTYENLQGVRPPAPGGSTRSRRTSPCWGPAPRSAA